MVTHLGQVLPKHPARLLSRTQQLPLVLQQGAVVRVNCAETGLMSGAPAESNFIGSS